MISWMRYHIKSSISFYSFDSYLMEIQLTWILIFLKRCAFSAHGQISIQIIESLCRDMNYHGGSVKHCRSLSWIIWFLNNWALFPLNQQCDSQEIYGPRFVLLLVHAWMYKLKFLCTETTVKKKNLRYSIWWNIETADYPLLRSRMGYPLCPWGTQKAKAHYKLRKRQLNLSVTSLSFTLLPSLHLLLSFQKRSMKSSIRFILVHVSSMLHAHVHHQKVNALIWLCSSLCTRLPLSQGNSNIDCNSLHYSNTKPFMAIIIMINIPQHIFLVHALCTIITNINLQ